MIEVKPNVVSQIKTVDHDGYNAVQLSYDEKKYQKHWQFFGEIVGVLMKLPRW